MNRWHLYCKAHEKWRAFRARFCWLFGHQRHDGYAWVPPDLYYTECRYCGEYLSLVRKASSGDSTP